MAKKITMMSSDKKLFEVEEEVAMEMQTIKNMIEDDCVHDAIPLPIVTADILSKVLDYCKKHAAAGKGKSSDGDDIKAWDSNFINVDQNTLYFLLLAANYLNIKSLMDLGCQKFADMIRGKTPEEIRQIFNIKNDFTPEEEEKIRNENRWAFE